MTNTLLLCARHELALAARSRWMHIFAAVFAALSLGVAASGYILSGGRGIQDFARTGASLVHLILLIVPLTAIVVGVLALTPDRGAAELLFSQPVARRAILLGKLLGLFEALAAAQAIGFGAAGLVIFWQGTGEGAARFALVILASLVITGVFLSLAAIIAVGGSARSRTRALALALVTWFAAAVFVDLAALGVASMLRSGPASRVLISAVLINPVSALRTAALLSLEGTSAFGAASLALLRFTHGPFRAGLLLSASLVLWIVLPVTVAVRRLHNADI